LVNTSQYISLYKVAELSAKAFARTFTIENAISSFRHTCTLNPDIITHYMFLLSVVTDILQQPEKVAF